MHSPFKRPGIGSYTATPGDAQMLALLGGGQTYEGVAFTRDQQRHLSAFYGYDPEYPARLARTQAALQRQAEAAAKAKNAGKAPYDSSRVRDPGPPDEKGLQAFMQAGDIRDLFRDARTDGLRVMAYLAKHLEPGEDPVALVHRLCQDAGYDVTGSGFKEVDEGDDAVGDDDGEA